MNKIIGTDIHCGIVADGTFTQFAHSKDATVTIKQKVNKVTLVGREEQTAEHHACERTSWSMSVGCLNYNNISDVWNIYRNRTKFAVSWREVGGSDCREFTGSAYIKTIKISDNIHSVSTLNIELQGTGEIRYRQV